MYPSSSPTQAIAHMLGGRLAQRWQAEDGRLPSPDDGAAAKRLARRAAGRAAIGARRRRRTAAKVACAAAVLAAVVVGARWATAKD